jgi:curved DNA-binding protein CbpA
MGGDNETFVALTEAFELLSDPFRRQVLDLEIAAKTRYVAEEVERAFRYAARGDFSADSSPAAPEAWLASNSQIWVAPAPRRQTTFAKYTVSGRTASVGAWFGALLLSAAVFSGLSALLSVVGQTLPYSNYFIVGGAFCVRPLLRLIGARFEKRRGVKSS